MYIGDRYGEPPYVAEEKQSDLLILAISEGANCASWDGRGKFDDNLQRRENGAFDATGAYQRLEKCRECPIKKECAEAHPTLSADPPTVAVEGGRLIRWQSKPELHEPEEDAEASMGLIIRRMLNNGWTRGQIIDALAVTGEGIERATRNKSSGICGENIILNYGSQSAERKGD